MVIKTYSKIKKLPCNKSKFNHKNILKCSIIISSFYLKICQIIIKIKDSKNNLKASCVIFIDHKFKRLITVCLNNSAGGSGDKELSLKHLFCIQAKKLS